MPESAASAAWWSRKQESRIFALPVDVSAQWEMIKFMNKTTGWIVSILAVAALVGWGLYYRSLINLQKGVVVVPQDQNNSTAGGIQNPAPTSQISLDLTTEFSQTYRTRLTQALKEAANFNGHYVMTDIGCGSGCFTLVAVDKNTGKVYKVPEISDIGKFGGIPGPSFSLNSDLVKVITDNGSRLDTFRFDGSSYVLISREATGY